MRNLLLGAVAALTISAPAHAVSFTSVGAVATPGGQLRVTVDEHTTTLHGPAVLVAHGELAPLWWDGMV